MSLGRTLLDVVWPRPCGGCGGPAGEESPHLCWECLRRLWPIQFPLCSVCGNPAAGAIEHDYVCALCSGRRRHFDRARSGLHFDGPVVRAVHALKYAAAAHLSVDLGRWVAACARVHYAPSDVDAVTFVPLHSRRERERTYNQSRLLAGEAARSLGKPLAGGVLVRVRDTVSQTALNSAERRDNVRGAFRARNERWIAGRRFLLVDDVMTTGATVDECARVLREAGAAAVRVATVARGV